MIIWKHFYSPFLIAHAVADIDFSNKTLALLLAATLIISITGFFINISSSDYGKAGIWDSWSSITGNVVGNVSLTVNTTASLIFQDTNKTIDWGSGYVNTSAGTLNCTLNTQGVITYPNCVGFNNLSTGLVLINIGNVNLNVSFNSTDTNETFIGGTMGNGPRFQWNISTNSTTTLCQVGMYQFNGTWTDINNSAQVICGNLSWLAGQNALKINVQVKIPANSYSGLRNVTFTATGTTGP